MASDGVFSKNLMLAKYADDIEELQNLLLKFSKQNTYNNTDSSKIADVCNKMRYLIEHYCFYLNVVQDFVQISIPLDPFVDVLDIFPNDDLPTFKQQNIIQLLTMGEYDKQIDVESSVFSEFDIGWFKFMVKNISFILEKYNFLKHWEAGYHEKIIQELQENKGQLESPSKARLFTKYTSYKNSIEKEENLLEEQEKPAESNDSADKIHTLTFKDKLKDKNQLITKSLVKSNQILKSTVLQTELQLEEIYIQGNLLTELNDKFDVLDTLLEHSSKLMKLIEKNGSKEKRQVYYSLGFLIVCVSWVLWKRVIRGPLKLLIWIWFNFFKRILYMTGFLKRATVKAGEHIFPNITSQMDVSDTTTALAASINATHVSSVASETLLQATLEVING